MGGPVTPTVSRGVKTLWFHGRAPKHASTVAAASTSRLAMQGRHSATSTRRATAATASVSVLPGASRQAHSPLHPREVAEQADAGPKAPAAGMGVARVSSRGLPPQQRRPTRSAAELDRAPPCTRHAHGLQPGPVSLIPVHSSAPHPRHPRGVPADGVARSPEVTHGLRARRCSR